MYVLDKLWRGTLSPSKQCCNYGSEYSNLRTELCQQERLILTELTEDGTRSFRKYQLIQEQMSAISEEDVFVNAFRIAVGLILDAIGTYDSQFVRYHED